MNRFKYNMWVRESWVPKVLYRTSKDTHDYQEIIHNPGMMSLGSLNMPLLSSMVDKLVSTIQFTIKNVG